MSLLWFLSSAKQSKQQERIHRTRRTRQRSRRSLHRRIQVEWLERRDLLSVEPSLLPSSWGYDSPLGAGLDGAEGESGQQLAPAVQYRLELLRTNNQPLPTDVNGNPVVGLGEAFRLVGYHKDITYDQEEFVGQGVFASYIDVFYTNADSILVRHGETQQLEFYPSDPLVGISGQFTLTFDGRTTAPITYTTQLLVLGYNIQQALEALPNIGTGNVRVSQAPGPQDTSSGVRPNAFRVQFLNQLGERDVPMLQIDSSGLNNLSASPGAVAFELFPADLAHPGTFRSAFTGIYPYIHGLNAVNKEELESGQPNGGRSFGGVGSFLEGFYLSEPGIEYPFFSVDLIAVAPGQVQFSANPPDYQEAAYEGTETLVFPTNPLDPKFIVEPGNLHFLQTIGNPLVLIIKGPPSLDIAGRSATDGTWLVGESTGAQFVSSPWGQWPAVVDWQDVVVGDFTGDGRDDVAGRSNGVWLVARSTPQGAVNEQWTSWSTTVSWTNVMVADVNGDGKDDIVGRNAANGDWWVAVSTGTRFVNQRWGMWSPLLWRDVMVADVNGDGKDDIVGRLSTTGAWWVAVSTGTAFVNQSWGTWSVTTWKDVMVGDVNGDGKDDIAGRMESSGEWWVALSTGTGFVNQPWGTWSRLPWQDVMVADVNGDGKDDIVGRWATTGQWWVAKSNGSSFANEHWGTWATVSWLDVQVADVNGDGRDDIVGRDVNGNWRVARSTGAAFNMESWGNWNPGVSWVDVAVIDLDGDGKKSDILGRGDGIWQVAKATDTGFENQLWGEWPHHVKWQDVMVADVTGDGLDDIVGRDDLGGWWVGRSTGSGFISTQWGSWSRSVSWTDVMVADVNGDGKGDIVGRNAASGDWWVALSTGTRFVNQHWGMWSPLLWQDIMIADVNGDGKDDIVGRLSTTGDWWVALSTGTGFVNQRWGTWSLTTWIDVMVGDVNGDGKDDIAGRMESNGEWWVALSTGTGFVNQRWGTWSRLPWQDVMIADVNGDGKDDIVGRWATTGQWWVARSTGSSFANQHWGTWPTVSWSDVQVADVNGDGRDDIVGRKIDGSWMIARSTGAAFVNEDWGSWSTGITWKDVLVGNFSDRIPDALHASGLPLADQGPVTKLAEADLRWILDAVVPRLTEMTDRDDVDHLLQSVTFQITDLPGTLLGQTLGTTISIDRDAAGFGWFVDLTPWADEEYSLFGVTSDLLAVPGGPADQRMDLLTVVMHELGHVLGYDHSDTGLMQPTLAAGVRYLWEDLLEDDLMDDGEGESAVNRRFPCG
jgi:hypothetical protein